MNILSTNNHLRVSFLIKPKKNGISVSKEAFAPGIKLHQYFIFLGCNLYCQRTILIVYRFSNNYLQVVLNDCIWDYESWENLFCYFTQNFRKKKNGMFITLIFNSTHSFLFNKIVLQVKHTVTISGRWILERQLLWVWG